MATWPLQTRPGLTGGMQSGLLTQGSDVGDFQRASVVSDGAGGTSRVWSEVVYAAVRIQFSQLNGHEIADFERRGLTVDWKAYTNQPLPNVLLGDRLAIASGQYVGNYQVMRPWDMGGKGRAYCVYLKKVA